MENLTRDTKSFLDLLHGRRSVRKFTSTPVSDDTLEELLRAAMSAPSAGNQQPWHFIVVRERALLTKIAGMHPYAGMVAHSQAAIIVCGDLAGAKYPEFWVQDCSAAVQNLLLAAHAMGLGSVWVGIYPMEDRVAPFREAFGLPPSAIPLAVLPIGVPVDQEAHPDRFQAHRVHLDRW